MNKLYKVSASLRSDDSSVVYFYHGEENAAIKYNRLKNELSDVVKNVRVVLVNEAGQKTED